MCIRDSYRTERNDARARADRLQGEVNDSRRTLLETEADLRATRDEREADTARLAELEAEVGQLTDRNVTLQTDVDDAEANQEALVAVRDELATANVTIRNGNIERERLTAERARLATEVRDGETETQRVTAELDNANTEIRRLRDNMEDMQRRLDGEAVARVAAEAVQERLQAMVDTSRANAVEGRQNTCLLYTSPSPRDLSTSRMPSSA